MRNTPNSDRDCIGEEPDDPDYPYRRMTSEDGYDDFRTESEDVSLEALQAEYESALKMEKKLRIWRENLWKGWP